MADNTKIEWADATLNYINGCSVVSPGCTNCYAMKLAGTRLKNHPTREGLTIETKAGPVWNGVIRAHEPTLLQALTWKKPRRIFWNAHGDLFHEAVTDAQIDRLFAVCALTPQHTHMILTKRSARMRTYTNDPRTPERIARLILDKACDWDVKGADALAPLGNRAREADPSFVRWPIASIWLGVSVEDQQRADERVPDLIESPAAMRFLSCEPLLGPVDLEQWLLCPNARDGLSMDPSTGAYECCTKCDWTGVSGALDWVIVGGESGPDARPMHPAWARSLRDQCEAAGVAFHFKQWGEWAEIEQFDPTGDAAYHWDPDRYGQLRFKSFAMGIDGRLTNDADRVAAPSAHIHLVGKKRAGRLLDGRSHDDFPT